MENNFSDIHVVGEYTVRSFVFEAGSKKMEKATVSVTDEIGIDNYSLCGFSITYERRVCTVPETGFALSIKMEGEVEFEDDAGKEKLRTIDRVREWVEANKARVVATFGMPRLASAMISSCLVHANYQPIITPAKVIPHADGREAGDAS